MEEFRLSTGVKKETYMRIKAIPEDKMIRLVENTLIKSKAFSLPDHKALLKNDVEYEGGLVDASETDS